MPACGRPADMLAALGAAAPPPLWPTLVARLPSESLAVRETVVTLRLATARLGHRADLCDPLEMTLAEALNNVVEHAYRDAADGAIIVELDLLDGGWAACRIWDRGRAMPQARIPASPAPDLAGPVASLPEGGFGWAMIRSLTQHLNYRRIDGRNCLSFALRGA